MFRVLQSPLLGLLTMANAIFFMPVASLGENPILNIDSHNLVAYAPGEFSAWPANKTAQQWVWGDEILIGHAHGIFEEREGHNRQDGSSRIQYTRSMDGGKTWTNQPSVFTKDSFPVTGLDFSNPGFALYIEEDHFGFYYSYDRGRVWNGPHGMLSLLQDPALAGHEFSARTDYLINSSQELMIFASSRNRAGGGLDYSYVATTSDGAKTFKMGAYIDPTNQNRQVMPSSVRWDETTLVSCLRRKNERIFLSDQNWIECYKSSDNGDSWASLGRVADTGDNNGNPPALVKTPQNQLVLVYGVRRRSGSEPSSISLNVSNDGGLTWSAEVKLRHSDYRGPDLFGDVDVGYARAFVRADGKIVAVYYWATPEHPEEHIEATIFEVQ